MRHLLLAVLLLTSAPTAVAHVPHDVVTGLAVSPAYANDQTIFAIVRDSLLRSTDGGGSWHRLTRDIGTGWPTSIQVSPNFAQDQTLFVGSRNGVYRSRDAGLHWQAQRRGLRHRYIASLVISPRFSTLPVVLAVTSVGSVFRTTNAGDDWTMVLPKGSDVTALEWAPGMLLAGTVSGQLHRSTDSGKTWRPYGQIPGSPKITVIESVRLHPTDDAVFVGTEDGLFRSASESRFTRLGSGLPDEPVTSLASLNEGGSVVLLAATYNHAIFRSDDNGTTWQEFDGGLKTDVQAKMEKRPQFSEIAISDDETIMLGGFCGVFRSVDHGRSWEKLHTLSNRLIVGLDVSPATGDGYDIVVTTYGGGVYSKGVDDSEWQSNNKGLPPVLRHPEGYRFRMGAVAFSPDYARDHMVLTATFNAVLRSTDGGKSWKKVPVEYEDDPRARVDCQRDDTVRPTPRLMKFQFAFGFAFSPAFAEDRTVFAAYRPEGLIRSVDGGASFSKIWHGCSDQVSSVVISPDYPRDRTLFASLNDGIYRSRDAGQHWKRVTSHPGSVKASLAISPRFGHDRTVYASGNHGLWRSQDAGDTWKQVKIGSQYGSPVAVGGLAISPFPGDHRELLVQILGGPLYLCRDYGDRFDANPVETSTQFSQMHMFDRDRVPLLAFSPNYPSDGTLYAASMDRLFKSTDRGLSWAPVPMNVAVANKAR